MLTLKADFKLPMQRSAQTISSPAFSNTPRSSYYSEANRESRSPYSPFTPTGHGRHSPYNAAEVVTTSWQCKRYMVGGLVPLQDQHMLSMLPSLLLMRMTPQRLLQSACAASFPAWCDRHLRQSALSWPLQRYHPSMVYLHPQDSFDMGTSPAATPAEPHYETTFSPYDRGSGQLHFPAQPHTMAAACRLHYVPRQSFCQSIGQLPRHCCSNQR